MAIRVSLVASIVLSCLMATGYGALFSALEKTLTVEASHNNEILKAGEDQITVNWSLDTSVKNSKEPSYKKIKVKLCFAPISQQDRAWRKTVDDLKKDKTCQTTILDTQYQRTNNSFKWTIERDVPTGTYFVRAYALDSSNTEVAYGQSTGDDKKDDLFQIQAISGRHLTLDICSVCFSAFSVISLFGFFFMEKRAAKRAAANQK